MAQYAQLTRLPPIRLKHIDHPLQLASHTVRATVRLPPIQPLRFAAHFLPALTGSDGNASPSLAALHWLDPKVPQEPTNPPPATISDPNDLDSTNQGSSGDIPVNPIAHEAWDVVPLRCRTRMFDFEKLREEYRRSYNGNEPPPEELAPGQRLTLDDIVYLTLLNSREYQTQKETLYRVALQLSLQRFAYQLKFSPFNNGTAANWNHTRSGGITENGLGVPTRFQVERMLATGGDFLARFANDVVLTFNGPTGFAADVGSDLFVEFDQTIFQRDVRFEGLTQSERDLVYAARDFTRFRKTQFTQIASQYYNLIRTYRQIEIDSQNYFALVRAFDQTRYEYRAAFLPRFQLDQVEQNVLSGRSRLIASCNNLEAALDNLKVRMGLPTETHINIDLTELEQLTTRDELSVNGQLVRRVRQRLLEERTRTDERPSRVVLLSAATVLIERMLETQSLQQRIGMPVAEQSDLPVLLRRLRVESARETATEMRAELQDELMTQPPVPSAVFLRTTDLIGALLDLSQRQLELAEQIIPDHPDLMKYREQLKAFRSLVQKLEDEQDMLIETGKSAEIPQLVMRTEELRVSTETMVQGLDQILGIPAIQPMPEEQLQQSLAESDRLLARSDELLRSLGSGLTPIEIDMDDAMLTALNLRFDLMNQRGDVADAWRQIKFAGDDLKAVLNVNASHRLSTRTDVNRVFDFTFDESDTRVRASFDAPFNRRAERNAYRQTLINYQAALRQLMQLEDSIKLGVRNDLRNLSLDKEQYTIEVASAALAYERTVSVLLELRLGIGRVAARDFLEAQNAYASSLSNVASRHIGYIIDRTQLFVDLELMTVGDDGFWHELYDESFQPEPYYQLPGYATPVYGELVPGLWYSRYLRRMEQVAPGISTVHGTDGNQELREEIPVPPPVAPMAPESP
jgi:outer membrane protein TolC